jgi:diaminohydroxyphosphoribosylaminopyrimidine deaminase / 5-amino-6-(5-phosphoribosylamino)uracil reductase
VAGRETGVDRDQAWQWLLDLAGASQPGRVPRVTPLPRTRPGDDPEAAALLQRYLPLCRDVPERFVVGHLGQSLDGRIATANGASHWVTGSQDLEHNHRMRALFDAVLVGAGTIRHDDPQLTVRAVPGPHPVRVVLDPKRRLRPDHRVFTDGLAPTLVVCDPALAGRGERVGHARVVGAACAGGRLCPRAVLDALSALGLRRVFVEGGGVTVSRFLAAGCLDRLQITIAPVILGSGRPSISLPEIDRLSAGLRPPVRRFALGDDVLFECRFDA